MQVALTAEDQETWPGFYGNSRSSSSSTRSVWNFCVDTGLICVYTGISSGELNGLFCWDMGLVCGDVWQLSSFVLLFGPFGGVSGLFWYIYIFTTRLTPDFSTTLLHCCLRVSVLIHRCDRTHSHVCCEQCIGDRSHSYLWPDSRVYVCVSWLIRECDMVHTHTSDHDWPMCDTTYSWNEWHNPFVSVIWLALAYLTMAYSCITWLIRYMRDSSDRLPCNITRAA